MTPQSNLEEQIARKAAQQEAGHYKEMAANTFALAAADMDHSQEVVARVEIERDKAVADLERAQENLEWAVGWIERCGEEPTAEEEEDRAMYQRAVEALAEARERGTDG